MKTSVTKNVVPNKTDLVELDERRLEHHNFSFNGLFLCFSVTLELITTNSNDDHHTQQKKRELN